MKTTVLAALCVALAAVSVGAFLKISRLTGENGRLLREAALKAAAPAPAAPAAVEPKTETPPDRTADFLNQISALEAEVKSLRRQLDDKEKQPLAAADTNRNEGRERGRRWDLAAIREADPERAKEIERQRDEFRGRIQETVNDQVAFLQSVDTARWPADMQANHAKLLETIAFFNDLMTKGPEAAGAGGEDRRGQIFTRMREAGELMEKEREMLLADTALSMGLDEKESRDFVNYMQAIDKATSPRGYIPGFGGRGGGRPRGGEAAPGTP